MRKFAGLWTDWVAFTNGRSGVSQISKCRHLEENCDNGCTESCHYGSCQWQKCRQKYIKYIQIQLYNIKYRVRLYPPKCFLSKDCIFAGVRCQKCVLSWELTKSTPGLWLFFNHYVKLTQYNYGTSNTSQMHDTYVNVIGAMSQYLLDNLNPNLCQIVKLRVMFISKMIEFNWKSIKTTIWKTYIFRQETQLSHILNVRQRRTLRSI